QRRGRAVDFEAVGLEQRLPAQVELVLYRMAQEALTNVAKHANASRVKVMLERRGERVRLVVEDDGSGFDVEATMRSKERGLGLFGMEERLALLGGRLAIQAQPGRGTRAEASLSLMRASVVPDSEGKG
ncbi:MAG: sensor histidine kinase, partial [Dehalococcoidia bacterium]